MGLLGHFKGYFFEGERRTSGSRQSWLKDIKALLETISVSSPNDGNKEVSVVTVQELVSP